MKAGLVVDASVAVKWFLREPDSDVALRLLEGDAEIGAPTLLRVEMAAAVVRRFRIGILRIEDARERIAEMEDVLAMRRFRFTPDRALLARAVEIGLEIRHAVQDCIYLACAERHNAEFVTADTTLLKRAAAHFDFVRAL